MTDKETVYQNRNRPVSEDGWERKINSSDSADGFGSLTQPSVGLPNTAARRIDLTVTRHLTVTRPGGHISHRSSDPFTFSLASLAPVRRSAERTGACLRRRCYVLPASLPSPQPATQATLHGCRHNQALRYFIPRLSQLSAPGTDAGKRKFHHQVFKDNYRLKR